MLLWILALIVFVVACLLTWCLRRYALARSLLDIPNSRSSHSLPTPRGGGVAFVIAWLAALPVAAAFGWLSWSLACGLIGAGAWIAVIGSVDDHGLLIRARWRLLTHFLGALWLLLWVPVPELLLFDTRFNLGTFGYVLVAVALVWMLNLYNFMDGIDGLAGIEAVTVCLSGALLYVLIGLPGQGIVPVLLAAAVAGFLVWNFPPARIFMGDAGSGFLGLMLGGLLLDAAMVTPQLLWAWLILLGVFAVDATLTLLQRILQRRRLDEAHRSHGYQHAAQRFGSHLPVTLGVLALNLLWLLPWACVVALSLVDGLLALTIAYLPLLLLAWYFKAGRDL